MYSPESRIPHPDSLQSWTTVLFLRCSVFLDMRPLIPTLLLSVIFTNSTAAIVIDDFSEGLMSITAPVYSGTYSDTVFGLDPNHVAGEARFISFNTIDPFPAGDTGSVTVETDPNDGVLRYLPDPGLAAANLHVAYGQTGLGLPAMSLDFLADGAERLSIDFNHTSAVFGMNPFFALDIVVVTSSAGFYSYSIVPQSDYPFTLDIPFVDMLAASPTLDLTEVVELQFGTGNGNLRGEVELSKVYTSATPVSGDFDRNGTVGEGDVQLWQRLYGPHSQVGNYTGYLSADENRNFMVDGFEFLSWQVATSVAPMASSVPEPAGYGLALFALLMVGGCRHQHTAVSRK